MLEQNSMTDISLAQVPLSLHPEGRNSKNHQPWNNEDTSNIILQISTYRFVPKDLKNDSMVTVGAMVQTSNLVVFPSASQVTGRTRIPC